MAKKPKAKKATKEANRVKTVEQERLEGICAASAQVRKAERRLAEAKKDLEDQKDIVKGRKAELVQAGENLLVEINDGDPTRPLQNVMEGRALVATPTPTTSPVATEKNGYASTIEDESWRDVVLSSVLSEKDMPLFSAADLNTVGDMADYTAGKRVNKHTSPRPGGRLLTEIEGIGPATLERIENRMAEFWASRKPETILFEKAK